MKKWYVWLLLALVLAIAALPWVCDREGPRMDDTARQELAEPDRVVALSMGATHYELAGSEGAPAVVLIHGTSGPMTIWDRTVPALVEAGYQVLRYDLYGRGYSDRIDADYGLDLYVAQLEELLSRIAVRPVVLVGSSLGAIIATEYALRHGEDARGVVMVGPAGFPLQATPLARLARVAGVGEYLMSVVGDRQMLAHHRSYFHAPERFEEEHARFAAQLRYQGSKRAILQTLRNAPLQSYLDGYARLGRAGVPALVIWGTDDRAFPYAHHTELAARIPNAELVTVEAAGHLPQLERPDVVGPALIRFAARALGRGPSGAAGAGGTR